MSADPTAGAGTTEPSAAATASNGAGEPTGGYDKGNLKERFLNEPDFAWDEYRKVQSHASQQEAKVQKVASLVNAAELLGNGDASVGSQQLLGLVDKAYRIDSDPAIKARVDGILNGTAPAEPTGDEYVDPDEEIRSLRQTVQELQNRTQSNEGEVLRTKVDRGFESYFRNNPFGTVLTAEERNELVDHVQSQVTGWLSNPNTRSAATGFNDKTVGTIATAWLEGKDGKLAELAGRMSQQKERQRQGFSTEVPSSVPSGAARDPSEFKDAAEAFRYAKERWGSAE